MRFFRAEEPSHDESMALIKQIENAIEKLYEAGMDAPTGRVQDVMAAKGHPVDISQDADGTYIVKRRR